MKFARTPRRLRLPGLTAIASLGGLAAALGGSGCASECLDNTAFYEQKVAPVRGRAVAFRA